jgi:sulfate transport system permease protein
MPLALRLKQRSVLPGFGLSLGFTLFYLSLIVLVPLAAILLRTMQITWGEFWTTITRADVVAALWLSFFAAFIAAVINTIFGLAVAWVFVRYTFVGKRVLDAIIDLPFALPTAVAGIALTTLYAQNGWIGKLLQFDVPLQHWVGFGASWWPTETRWYDGHLPWPQWNGLGASGWPVGLRWLDHVSYPWLAWTGWAAEGALPVELVWYGKVAYSPIGVVVALSFIGLPFVVRTVQPVLADMTMDTEEAAASLGAGRLQTFRRVIFPQIWPALITGFALAFARAVGEYGSVVFIAGNLPLKTEIAPLMIIKKLEEYDYTGATSIALVMLVISFTLLLVINVLQRWISKRSEGTN